MTGALDGKRAVVTGAGGALGSSIASRFAAEGVAAIALVDIDSGQIRASAQALREQAEGRSLNIEEIVVDVTDHDAVLDRYQQISSAFGGIDISVNNAGIVAPSGRIHNVSPEDFRQVLDVNLMGIFNTMKASVIAMRGAGGGSIVNTASVAGFTNWTHNSPYGASKAAVIHLTKIAAAEYAHDQIRVNCVSPGTFVTSFHDDLPDGAMDGVLARHPLGRFGETTEIASAYVYLASDQTAWVTGTNLVFDGGMSVSQQST
jgi:NAD(P)-dependent dehydrogenase (short-subunit alcohol dehydrogenase family)